VGHPVSVLVGHEAAVTFVGFNDAVPGGAVLLSSSWDGTCRCAAVTGTTSLMSIIPVLSNYAHFLEYILECERQPAAKQIVSRQVGRMHLDLALILCCLQDLECSGWQPASHCAAHHSWDLCRARHISCATIRTPPANSTGGRDPCAAMGGGGMG
jgi:hypothetical protein